VVGIEAQQHESGVAVGGGQVTVQDLLGAERGGGNVDGLFELEGQFGGGDLIDAGADCRRRRQPARWWACSWRWGRAASCEAMSSCARWGLSPAKEAWRSRGER
jgi:hypothetical protein